MTLAREPALGGGRAAAGVTGLVVPTGVTGPLVGAISLRCPLRGLAIAALGPRLGVEAIIVELCQPPSGRCSGRRWPIIDPGKHGTGLAGAPGQQAGDSGHIDAARGVVDSRATARDAP